MPRLTLARVTRSKLLSNQFGIMVPWPKQGISSTVTTAKNFRQSVSRITPIMQMF